MKHLLCAASLCLLCLSVSPAQQADSTESGPKIQEALIMTGVAFPYLPLEFRNHSKTGYNVGAGYSLSLAPGSVGYSSFQAVAEYSLFRFDGKRYTADIDSTTLANTPGFTVTQRPAKAFSLTINYRGTFTSISSSFAPYFLIGIGYSYFSVPPAIASPDTTLGSDGVNVSAVVWSFGLGVDIPLNDEMGVFLQGKSILGALDHTRQIFPVVAGFRYRL